MGHVTHWHLFCNPGTCSKLVLTQSPSAVPALRLGAAQSPSVLTAAICLPLLSGCKIQVEVLQAV